MNPTPDTKLRRLPERGSTDFDLAAAIIDDAVVCHVGFEFEGQPYVVPMACARDGDQLLVHGSIASRLMKNLGSGLPCCVTVTHMDGMVLARSAFHSSMNYRSVMVFGTAQLLEGNEKMHAFDALVEHLIPGRTADLREPTRQESNATTMLTLPIKTFTVKTRTGGPDDPKKDLEETCWAGVVPLAVVPGEPIPADNLDADIPVPDYL